MGAANGVRDLAFAEALYTPGMEAGFLEPAGLDLAAADLLGSTTHIAVIDAAGLCASVTCSNGSGSGVLVPGTGVILNNMLGEEDLNPLGFHRIEPGRRVPSMMAPTLVLRDGEIVLALGSAGSNRIRSAILQTVVRVVEQGLPVAAAVEAPRLHFERGVVQAEPGIDEGALAAIEAARSEGRALAGAQPILRRRAGGGARSEQRCPQRRRRPPSRRGGGVGVTDFEAEGLLDELEGEARAARLALLQQLEGEGVALEELHGRSPPAGSTLLPVERAVAGGGPRYTPREIAEKSGLDLELLQRYSAALGVPYPDPDSPDGDRGRPRGGDPDQGAARRRPARGRDAAGGAHGRA